MARELLIYGSGGFAREVAWLAQEAGYVVVGFLDDDSSRWGRKVNGIPSCSPARVLSGESNVELLEGCYA